MAGYTPGFGTSYTTCRDRNELLNREEEATTADLSSEFGVPAK